VREAPPPDGMKVFWSIAVEAGDVKEPWPNGKWLDDSFLKTGASGSNRKTGGRHGPWR